MADAVMWPIAKVMSIYSSFQSFGFSEKSLGGKNVYFIQQGCIKSDSKDIYNYNK